MSFFPLKINLISSTSSMQYVGIKNTAELEACWEKGLHLLGCCPLACLQNCSREKEDNVSSAAFVIHPLSKTLCIYCFTTYTYFERKNTHIKAAQIHTHTRTI